MKKAYVSFGILTLSLLLLSIFPIDVFGSASGTIYSVVYIYATDLTTAQKLRSLMLSYGIAVDLVSNSSAETWNYSSYGLIIIGHDTGNGNQWEPSAATLVINATGKPILALGEGGYAFFGKLGLYIGYPHGMHGNRNATYVMSASHRIFNKPISISIPTNQTIQLYNTSVPSVEIYLPSPINPDITVLGRNPVQTAYYNLIQEKDRYVIWGFHPSPDYLTQTGKNLFINTVLWLLGWETPSSNSVAFVYSTNLEGAQSFETLLEANGVTVDLVPKMNAETWDYSPYGLIIIGNDTAKGYDWTPESAVSVINATGKPILGLCYGGSSFFQELGLFVNWGHGMQVSRNNTYVLYPEHQIFNFPNTISIPPNKIIQLYTTSVTTVEIYMPSPQPGVNPLGQDSVQPAYYLILQEDARYVFWGFSAPPTNMTQTGKNLFVNIVIWMLGNVIPEFPSFTIMPLIIVLSTATVIFAKRKLKA